ncbi:terminase large subunit [Paracoccus sp. (in: a-proteobacteria)]|uniref:terminase large subunit n=1 Tax=Paracoccus sp. TaxID=267 RepID=UPI0028AE0A51|nr:terminase TerL endonuclease subunit [Paracoccus sp. (in: a-proteobacteria)]
MTRGERVIAFIERHICVPEGRHVGKPLVLMEFQRRFIKAVYDNPHGTRRAYLSIGRKNGKSALIAAMALAHIVGPEAKMNSQIVSGAGSQKQAALVFKLMQKMVMFSSVLRRKSVTRIVPSQKQIIGVKMNVEYVALSAEAGTAHGLSPILAILDETGQVKGPEDDFIEAIETSQGAYDKPLLIAISTQAATDNDLYSRWLDDAETSQDPTIVSHVYTAPKDCEVLDREAWRAANPAMGEFRSIEDIEALALRADRLPSEENKFRWLFLNQRIEATAPFVSRKSWQACGGPVLPLVSGAVVFGGLDLSEVSDLTALVLVSPVQDGLLTPVQTQWHVHPTFWLPGQGLREKSKADRVPYDEWHKAGHLQATHGPTVDYEFVAAHLWDVAQRYDVRKIAFDRWNWRHLKPWLLKAGFSEAQLEGDTAIFEPLGQGFQSMSPALRDLESAILNGGIVHGGHPVLEMCANNAVVQMDPAGNRKLAKHKSRGRIDGMVALAMAMSVAGTWEDNGAGPSVYEERGILMI